MASTSTRLHGGMTAVVAGIYLLVTLGGLSTVPDQLAAALGIAVLGHGVLLLAPFDLGLAAHSGVPFLGYGTLMLLDAVWTGGGAGSVAAVWAAADQGQTALAVLVVWSGVVVMTEEEAGWLLP